MRANDKASRAIAEAHAIGADSSALRRLEEEEPYATPAGLARVLPDPVTGIFLITGPQATTAHDFRGALAAPQERMVTTRHVDLTTERTPYEIADAIAAIPVAAGNVIAIVRGGGDADAFWAFDHPAVVQAITSTRTPVLTALGHRRDVTWADRVADAAMSVPAELGTHLRAALAAQYFAGRRRASRPPRDSPPSPRPPSPGSRPAAPAATPPAKGGAPRLPPARTYPNRVSLGPPPPPPPQPFAPPATLGPRGFGVASLVLGILSVVTFGGLGIVPLVGIVLGMCDIGRRPRAAAVTGIVLNGLALCGALLFLALLAALGTGTPVLASTPTP